jgi:hypothetical protein
MTFASPSTLLATLLLLAAAAALPASARHLPPPPSPPSASNSATALPAAAAPGYQGVHVVKDVKEILEDDPDTAATRDIQIPSTLPRQRSSSEGPANARPDGWPSNGEESGPAHTHMTLNMRLKSLVGRCRLTLSNPRRKRVESAWN